MKFQAAFAFFHPMTLLITALLSSSFFWPSSLSVSLCSGSNLTNSESTEHLIKLEFDQSLVEDRRNSFVLKIVTNYESPYRNASIFLQRIPSFENPFLVFEIKANGQKEKIERNFKPELFQGYLKLNYDDQQQEQSEIPVQAMGTLNLPRNEISLVITAKSFYIAPRLSGSNETNHNFYTILRTKDPANSFQMVNFDPVPKLIQPATFQRRTFRRDTKDNKVVESEPKKKYCSIKFNYHYDMYEKFGKNINLIAQHAKYMEKIINQIFWSHKWTRSGYDDKSNSQVLENYGIILSELNVETEPTNHDTNKSAKIINNFSDPDVCLVHNFTNVELFYLDRKINGLSYVKSIFNDRNMGISSFYFCENFFDYYCILSFAHELGHSFGSPHDYDGADCLPSNDGNGSFIMNEPFMAEFGPNNFRFSPCSIRSIYVGIKDSESKFIEFLPNKLHFRDHPECGNYVVEGEEKCDEGPKGHCCDDTCNIKTGASCSPTQDDALCCDFQTCQPKSQNERCLFEDLRLCLNFSVCDGQNISCPAQKHLSDNTSCYNGGYCFDGKCKICQRCDCPSVQCWFCCWDKNQGICQPHAHRPDYTPCSFNDQKSTYLTQTAGQCIEGECVKWSPKPSKPDQRPDQQEEDKGISYTTIFIFVCVCSFILILAMYATYRLKKWATSTSDQNDGSRGLMKNQQGRQDES